MMPDERTTGTRMNFLKETRVKEKVKRKAEDSNNFEWSSSY